MDGNEYAIRATRVISAPGVGSELLLRETERPDAPMLLWLPGMGMPARHYLPLAEALAGHGICTALHEWRGVGSSSVRATRYVDWGYRELLAEDLPAAVEACRKARPQAPILIGGHSLGGQLGCLYAGLNPDTLHGLVLVASGSPYWRCFRPWGVPLHMAFTAAQWLARLRGHFPGRRVGFAGKESRGVMADWARSGRSGRYAAKGMARDLDEALSVQTAPVLALRMETDPLGPERSLRHLLGKMPRAPSETQVLDAGVLGMHADHSGWMKSPEAIAERIAAWSRRLD